MVDKASSSSSSSSSSSFKMNFEDFGKLPQVPVEVGIIRWQNMLKQRVMKVVRIDEVPQERFTGYVLHFIQANGVEGRTYPPKSFLHHIKVHRQDHHKDIFFYIKDNAPEGEVDFDIRFK